MTITLPSVLTMSQATAALVALRQPLRDDPGPLVAIDAGEVVDMDTSAISLLLQCRRDLQARGLQMIVLRVPPKLAALMTLYGVSELLVPTNESAAVAR